MDFISFLQNHVAVPIWIIGAIALLSGIVAIYKNFSEICKILKKIINLFIKFFSLRKRNRRKKYNEVVASEDYLTWQNNILNNIYDPIITKFNENSTKLNCSTCERAVCFPKTDNAYQYESVFFKVDENLYPYPFREISNKDDLTKCKISVKKFSHKKFINYKPRTKEQKSFYKLMKPTIHFPDNIGYALDEISFENGFHFTAKACTYKMNVCTSNIMEYELYELYLKEKKGKCPVKDKLKELKTRNQIHKIFENNIERIFTSGAGRSSLLGVQAMVLCKNNYTGCYDVLRIRRSENVDAKSGFLQFVPSGGFSALNNNFDYDTQFAEFSVAKALLRELLEECFGEEDFSGRKLNSTENIYSDKIIDKLISNKGLIFKFIGSAFSLVSLRHELCFLLVIEDKELVNSIRENEECSSVIQFISLNNLEKQSFWVYNVEDDKVNDCKLLNPTSAALWNLVQKTDIYQKLLNQE
ncbi:MAG: hypothetical protein K2L02_01755 [Clostridia bacterium]|nr:hypothetical protein [Clostridia bacterium]